MCIGGGINELLVITSIVAVLKSHSVLLPVGYMEWCCFPLKNLVVFRTSCNSCFELPRIRWVRLMEFSACLSTPAIHVLERVMDLHGSLPDVLARSCWKGRHSYWLSWVLALLPAPTFCFSFGTLLLIWSMIQWCREINWQKTYFTKIEKCPWISLLLGEESWRSHWMGVKVWWSGLCCLVVAGL